MPTINIYGDIDGLEKNQEISDEIIAGFKKFVAEILSCGDRTLASNEISVRLIQSKTRYMISELECSISAHHYKERIDREDELCNLVKNWLAENIPGHNYSVWLQLSELGHSF